MERLTHRDDKGMACIGFGGLAPTAYESKAAIDRLAAYEDTGLTPEEVELYKEAQEISESMEPGRLVELAQAEKDGRLVVLPEPHGCPRGDMRPFFECPKCGGHHVKWVANFDLSVCMDCGWDSHEKSVESLIALIRNRERDISILSDPNWRDTLAKRREEPT